jgi:hypothetical protein
MDLGEEEMGSLLEAIEKAESEGKDTDKTQTFDNR